MNKKILVTGIAFIFAFGVLIAQDNVGFGTTTPHSSALLDMTSTDKGLLIPRVQLIAETNGTNPVNGPATGLLVFNESGALPVGFYYWNGTQWVMVGAGGVSCNTLDEAYDCGGAGVGKDITSDAGSVSITLPSTGTSNSALDAVSNKTTSWAIGAENTETGVAVLGEVNGVNNEYNAIQGSSYSNYNSGGGIGSGGVSGFYEGTGDGVGIYGQVVNTSSDGQAGVFGINSRTNGGYGVNGQGYAGVVGEGVVSTIDGFGVYGTTNNGIGVQGETADMSLYGVSGLNYATNETGDGIGVMGDGNIGVWGQTNDGNGFGVFGFNNSNSTTANNIGTGGEGFVGVYGVTNSGGFGVYSDGDFGSSGTKSFVIDHPIDPANKILKHYCMESPEVLNLYRGNVSLDENGEAIIELPKYFESINKNFSYNLTPIGASANLYVKKKIENGQFTIAGGNPNMEVSWTVYAERNDKYIQNYPDAKAVEINKREAGKYIRPELYGKTHQDAIFPRKKVQKTLKIKDENLGKKRMQKTLKK